MTTDTNELLASLARARTDFETRLAALPQWRELKELEKSPAANEEATRRRATLVGELNADPVYRGWVEIGASMAKLAAGVTSGADVQTSAAAAAQVPRPPSLPDDLKRIRGITQEVAVALHRLGVRRFADIAGWTAADVARVSAALGLGEAISRQNWIEQAAARHLSQGGRLETTAPRRAAAQPPEITRTAAAAGAAAAIEVVPAPPSREAEAATEHDDLTRIRGIRAPLAEALNKAGVTRFADIANWTAEDVSRIAAALGLGDRISRESWIEQAAMRVPAGSLRVVAPRPAEAKKVEAAKVETAAPAAVATVASTAAAPATALHSGPLIDDLAAIRGLRPAIAEKLKGLGITRFEQIANWTSEDVRRIAGELGLGERISREGWIEQAAVRVLAQGGRLKPAAAVAATAPATKSETARAVSEPPSRAPETRLAVPASFATALAAIKAGLTAPLPAAAAAAAPIVAPAPAAEAPRPDKLDRIAGVDVRLAKALNVLGATRFADIAAWRAADVKRIEAALARPGAISRGGWIEQAAVLARGGVTAHAARVDSGIAAAVTAYPAAPLAPLPRPAAPAIKPVAAAASVPVPPIEVRMAPPPVLTAQPVRMQPQAPLPPSLAAPSPQVRPASTTPAAATSPQTAMDVAASSGPAGAAPISGANVAAPLPASAQRAPVAASVAAPAVRPAPAAIVPPAAAPLPPVLQPAAVTAVTIPAQSQWPSMTSASTAARAAPFWPAPQAATAPAPMAPLPPPVDVNAMPGPAEHVPSPAREVPPAAAAPVEVLRAESGLAAALAAAAATASVSPRLAPGTLSEQIRSLPNASDPYLDDLSDWVEDAAHEFPGAGESGASVAAEADVSIVRAAPGDLGALTPGSDGVFDGASYAAYRRQVGEASVDIVRAAPEGGAAPLEPQTAPAQPQRGFRRFMRAIRGDPKAG